MADTTDLKSVGASREGSSPSFATPKKIQKNTLTTSQHLI